MIKDIFISVFGSSDEAIAFYILIMQNQNFMGFRYHYLGFLELSWSTGGILRCL